MVEALKENGIPVTYLLYPDEGHGFARPENKSPFMRLPKISSRAISAVSPNPSTRMN